MSFFVDAMVILFVAAWCIAVAAWLYGTRFFLPVWAVWLRKTERHADYVRKAINGYAVFVGAALFGLAVGGLAELAGGWH